MGHLTMTNLYFACTDCKIYIDAGYSWASWTLEEADVVKRGDSISVEAVLAAEDYWNPPRSESSTWLYNGILPSVHRFLEDHREHVIIFATITEFLSTGDERFLDWMQVGFMPQLLPRYFVERLGFKSWDQVCNFVAENGSTPWWWMLDWENVHDKAVKKFHQAVESKAAR